MQEIKNVADLKNAIQAIESAQEARWKSLQQQTLTAFDSLKPINLIKSTLRELSSSPYLLENVIGTATGVASGYISRKIMVGSSAGLIKRIGGAVLQFGVTNLVAQNPEIIMKFGRYIFEYFTSGKSEKTEKP